MERYFDIWFHDKSKFDEKSTILVTDNIGINNILWELIKNNINDETIECLKNKINHIIKSRYRKGCPRIFINLMHGKFTIDKIIRIEYGNEQKIHDSDDISSKEFEFSTHTISELIKKGTEDTLNYITDLVNWL